MNIKEYAKNKFVATHNREPLKHESLEEERLEKVIENLIDEIELLKKEVDNQKKINLLNHLKEVK